MGRKKKREKGGERLGSKTKGRIFHFTSKNDRLGRRDKQKKEGRQEGSPEMTSIEH